MKKTLFISGFLILIFSSLLYAKWDFGGSNCGFHTFKKEHLQTKSKLKPTDSLYFQPQYFILLYKHIISNGKLETANASSVAGQSMMVEYRSLLYNNLTLRVDVWKVNLNEVKNNRIYFSIQQPTNHHFGNILMTDNKVVKIECQNNADAKKVYEIYNEIVHSIDKNQSK